MMTRGSAYSITIWKNTSLRMSGANAVKETLPNTYMSLLHTESCKFKIFTKYHLSRRPLHILNVHRRSQIPSKNIRTPLLSLNTFFLRFDQDQVYYLCEESSIRVTLHWLFKTVLHNVLYANTIWLARLTSSHIRSQLMSLNINHELS